jgi:hypothetical protein
MLSVGSPRSLAHRLASASETQAHGSRSTGSAIRSFEDRWEGGILVYVSWMRDRMIELWRRTVSEQAYRHEEGAEQAPGPLSATSDQGSMTTVQT